MTDGSSIRIAVVGESMVGKTSIAQRVCKRTFVEGTKSSVGVDKSEFSLNVSGEYLHIDLLDMAGRPEYHSLVSCFLGRVDAVIFVYDISDRETFVTLPLWNSLVFNTTGSSKKVVKILVGNKKDLAKRHREVPFKTAKNYANFEGMVALEVSAKSDDDIDLLFQCIAQEHKTLRAKSSDNSRKAKEKSWTPLVRNFKSIFSRVKNFRL